MIFISEINISASLIQSVNNMFTNLLSSIFNNIASILDELVFIDTSISSDLVNIMGTDLTSGILLICNSLIYGFVLYYASSYLFSYLTFSQVERPTQFIFKLILSAISINGSLMFCEFLIYIISLISSSIKLLGENLFNLEISFATLIDSLNTKAYFLEGSFNLFSFDGLLRSLISIGFINLTISYAVRFVMIKVFILISPFSILSLTSNKSNWLFKSWFKIFLSMLFLQILIAFILIIYFTISSSDNNIINQLIQIGIIFALVKANTFINEFMGGLSSDVNLSISSFTNLFKGGN